MMIRLGGVKQGDDVINHGIVAGHVVGTKKDAVRQKISHVVGPPQLKYLSDALRIL